MEIYKKYIINMKDNYVDDVSVNRNIENINVKKIFKNPDKIHLLQHNKRYFARNTCFDNKEFNVNLNNDGYVEEGSSGVARRGLYKVGPIIKSGIIKIIINNKNDVDEFKYAIESNIIVPDSVVSLDLIEKCDLLQKFKYIPGKNDSIYPRDEILIIGMEEGGDFSTQLYSCISTNNTIEFENLIEGALITCDNFNKHGFFHRDIKPQNIIIVKRNGFQKPVLIDFGNTCYMKKISSNGRMTDLSAINPPLDSFFLLLYIDRYYTNAAPRSIKNIIFNKMIKYYSILRSLSMTNIDIENINKYLLDAYMINENFSDFLKKINQDGIQIIETPDIHQIVEDRSSNSFHIINTLNNTEIKFSQENKLITLKNELNSFIARRESKSSPISSRRSSPISSRRSSPISSRRSSPISSRRSSPVSIKRSPLVVSSKRSPLVSSKKYPPSVSSKRSPPSVSSKRSPPGVSSKKYPPSVSSKISPSGVSSKKYPPEFRNNILKDMKWPADPYFLKLSKKVKESKKPNKKYQPSIYSPSKYIESPSKYIESPSKYIPGKYKMPRHGNSPVISTTVQHSKSPKYMKLERYVIPRGDNIMYENYNKENKSLKHCYDRKRKNGDDLTTKEAQDLCKLNGLNHTGSKKILCDRLRNNIPPLCL
jgi:hypothetical protein